MISEMGSIDRAGAAGCEETRKKTPETRKSSVSLQRRGPIGVLGGVMALPRLIRAPSSSDDALTERTDDELMRLARAGLKSAFAVLVERHALRVVACCSRLVNDAELGRELAQDAWVLVWQSRDKYRAEGGFVPWLVTVARNHCRNELRRRARAVPEDRSAAPAEPSPGTGPLDLLLVEEQRKEVRSALFELAVPLREALLLRFGEELRYDEMSSVAGTGESTLRSRVHHGLKALRQKLLEDS
jgi:RNA polymerase sigma-70 factor (ECF subfamily)